MGIRKKFPSRLSFGAAKQPALGVLAEIACFMADHVYILERPPEYGPYRCRIFGSSVRSLSLFPHSFGSLVVRFCSFSILSIRSVCNMLHFSFLLALLSSVASAQVVPADSALPSFALVTPGATIEPPSILTPAVTPTPTPSPVDDDQPDPNNSSIQLPASQSFNPSQAPAFTASAGVPDISAGPVYSSTPCSDEVTSTPIPQYPGIISSLPLPVVTPTPMVPSDVESTPNSSSATTMPSQTSSPDEKEPPCDDDKEEPAVSGEPLRASAAPSNTISPVHYSPYPTGSGHRSPPMPLQTGSPVHNSPYPTGTGHRSPPKPLGTGRPAQVFPGGQPGFGWARPRPSGMWPKGGFARPTRGFGRRPRPTRGFEHEKFGKGSGKGAATTTPCTLETRVRPTPTVAPLLRRE
jgi:hypothetical protein